jgi:hypothetical protein
MRGAQRAICRPHRLGICGPGGGRQLHHHHERVPLHERLTVQSPLQVDGDGDQAARGRPDPYPTRQPFRALPIPTCPERPADSHLSRARTRACALTLTPTPIDPACAPILMPTHDLAQPTHTHVLVNCDHVSLRERETPRRAACRGAGAGGFKRTADRCTRQPTRRVISSSKSSPSRTRCASPRTDWLGSPPSTSAFATSP